MKVRSRRSNRIYDAIEVDGELLVTLISKPNYDPCPIGTTFVLGHWDVELMH